MRRAESLRPLYPATLASSLRRHARRLADRLAELLRRAPARPQEYAKEHVTSKTGQENHPSRPRTLPCQKEHSSIAYTLRPPGNRRAIGCKAIKQPSERDNGENGMDHLSGLLSAPNLT